FDKILADSQRPNFFDGATDEDIHTLVIRKLEEEAGEVAAKIHTGRSRNEQVSTDFRIWVKKEIRHTQDRLASLMAALLAFARREPAALLPGYTHLRRAQPVLWAHYLLAYFEMLRRDWERFEQAYERADSLPLGSGALAGSGFDFDGGFDLGGDAGFESGGGGSGFDPSRGTEGCGEGLLGRGEVSGRFGGAAAAGPFEPSVFPDGGSSAAAFDGSGGCWSSWSVEPLTTV
ncbi:MAG: hypothetical protein IIA67_07745, partial [Planctomycetes bacterium]|nr:hypothetical protein [Planctomycetota bacterium]